MKPVRFQTVCAAAIVLSIAFLGSIFAPVVSAATARLANVKVAPSVIRPIENQTAVISYLAVQEGQTEIVFYSSDFAPVRSIVRNRDPKGLAQVIWDGKDNLGNILPDGPYFFTIRTRYTTGATAEYDPTLFSGGEKLPVSIYPTDYDPKSGRITYALPQPARIRIRAGLHDGPMYSTILDWKSRPAGVHQVDWDGWSDDRMVRIAGNPGLVITVEAYSLPENSIILEDTGVDPALVSQSSGETGAAVYTPQNVRNYFMVRSRTDESPDFSLLIDGIRPGPDDLVPVSGEVMLKVEADEETKQALIQNRFELVVFLDDQRVDEVEYGYIPLTYVLDAGPLDTGEHLVTVSLVTLTGQHTSRSARIVIRQAK
mgnify:CR=1 FL=1